MVLGFTIRGIHFAVKRNRTRAIWLGALVVSHWFLDLLVHGPDLPLAPFLPVKFGLGLWNSFAGTIVVESLIFVVGAFLYIKSTKAINRTGSYALWSYLFFWRSFIVPTYSVRHPLRLSRLPA